MTRLQFKVIVAGIACMEFVALCSPVAAAVKLELKLAKGKTYYQKTNVEQQIAQTMMGQEQKSGQSMGTGLKLQVLDVDAQKNMRIQYTYLWLRLKQSGLMAQVDYDSAKQTTAPSGAEGFAALLGQSYTARLTPQGKVLDVNGVEQLAEAVRKKLPAGMEATPAMSVLSPYLDKRSVKDMIEAAMAIYPDRPVSPGDSWSKHVTMAVGFTMVIDSKWTLQKEEAGAATIGLTATVQTDPNAPPMEAGGMKMKSQMSGTQEGTMRIVEATGLAASSQERAQIKGQIAMLAPGQDQPAMVMPMTIETQISAETGEQMWKDGPK
jgi:hypothetical protein